MCDPFFPTFYRTDTSHVDYEKSLGTAKSSVAAEAVVCEGLVQKLCRALMNEAEAVDTGKPLHSCGVDFLVAVELRSWFTKEMGGEMAVQDIMESGSIKDLAAEVVAGNSQFVNAEVKAAVQEEGGHFIIQLLDLHVYLILPLQPMYHYSSPMLSCKA